MEKHSEVDDADAVHVSPSGHRVAGRTASGGLLYAVKFGVNVTPPLSVVGGGGRGRGGRGERG